MKRVLVLLLLATPASQAFGQPQPAPVSDMEVPQIVLEQVNEATRQSDEALDLANVVVSAAKGLTTVQEAPAIVTVVTADEIKDRQFQDITQVFDGVPGWYGVGYAHSTFDTPLIRGQVQAVQFLHDGVSLFDPFVNIPTINRSQPMELIKRVEMITGPGGVLWGSNSLLGIMNVITKDAEDVEGVEVGGSLGNGDGDRKVARAYVMAGKSDMMGGKLKLFGHGSVDTYQGALEEMPILFFHDPLPLPNSPNTYGPLADAIEGQSLIVNLDAKLTYDKLQIRLYAPFGKMYKPFGLSGNPARDEANPNDPTGAARLNRSDTFDRYAVAEYRTRFAGDKAGITARAYAQQFVRGFDPLSVLTPSPLIQGGIEFSTDLTSYRGGGAVDGDVELTNKIRVLYGGEAFREWENGPSALFEGPTDLTRLPILCPRTIDATGAIVIVPGCPVQFAYAASRTVMGAYLNPQWRPTKDLIFDLGGRVQVAPESLGTLGYPVNTTVAGTIVWGFIPNWHLKLNYAQGFRPPVFNNTTSNGEAVQIGGNPNLGVETSDAAQAEINARIFKGDRRIRELSFRVDASYTRLDNLIQITQGAYANSGPRGVASAEFLGKLYVQGGHRLELGYTFMQVDTSDKGVIKELPQHWFNIATVFNLVTNRLSATTNLKIVGSAEDPNRLVEYRGTTTDPMGNTVAICATGCNVAATDLVLDRLPPIAELSLGLTWSPTSKMSVRATVYDTLFGHYYQPDMVFDYEPHLLYLPNPYQGFRAYVSALLQL